MSVENRLTADQLAALAPGDAVTIESTTGIGRPRRTTGHVVRVEGPHVVVRVTAGRGATYAERFSRRDGTRLGGLTRAELVNPEGADPGATSEQRQQAQQIHNLYRAWNRSRGDVDILRQLHAAIGNYLGASVG